METLKNHKLLIDNECPMCRVYGGAFEKFKYVEAGTCLPYQKAGHLFAAEIDPKRARNEIALYDGETGQAIYGIDALTKVLTNPFPIIGHAMSNKAIHFIMFYLYKFISQNRKVIAPTNNLKSSCVPDVDLKYRFAYVLLVAFLSTVIIFNFSEGINIQMGWRSNFGREVLICFGQIIWQLSFLNAILKKQKWEYIGNLSTVSLIGTFLLIPGLLLPAKISLFWFMGVVGIMTVEHLRRCKLLQIGLWPTISWLSYRIVVIGILIFINQ